MTTGTPSRTERGWLALCRAALASAAARSSSGFLAIKNLPEELKEIWKCLDRGDWIGIEGETFTTRTGEPTVKLENFTVLSK